MKYILLLGAGRSSVYLIDYFIAQASVLNWHLIIADWQTEHLENQLGKMAGVTLTNLNIHNQEQVSAQVRQADLVISLLPAPFHLIVAKTCLEFSRNLITASYVSPEIRKLHQAAQEKKVLFLMECGLDPGIDHMSAMTAITQIRERRGELYSFKSYAGGLVAPESDTNPWHYKISWNPRNMVLAGQGTAKYLENGNTKYIPYHQLFNRTETLTILNAGEFEAYANRDSEIYRELYGLPQILTILRGTLRRPGFCRIWLQLVRLGLTDDSYTITEAGSLTYAQWLQSYLPSTTNQNISLKEQVAAYLNTAFNSMEMKALNYLGLFENEEINLENATPAQILEKRLVQKLKLQPADKDLVVMQHEFKFTVGNQHHRLNSSLLVTGENATYTAMAKTVGLPLAIAAKLILQNKLTLTGVQIPIFPEIYDPVLAELKQYGIQLVEVEELL